MYTCIQYSTSINHLCIRLLFPLFHVNSECLEFVFFFKQTFFMLTFFEEFSHLSRVVIAWDLLLELETKMHLEVVSVILNLNVSKRETLFLHFAVFALDGHRRYKDHLSLFTN